MHFNNIKGVVDNSEREIEVRLRKRLNINVIQSKVNKLSFLIEATLRDIYPPYTAKHSNL